MLTFWSGKIWMEMIYKKFPEFPSRILPEGGKDLNRICKNLDYLSLNDILPEAFFLMPYSGADNFFREDLYGNFTDCFLVREIAFMVVEAEKNLRSKVPNLRLLIFDGARPVRVQKRMWEVVENTEFQNYIARPGDSLHNYGAAIDLSLSDRDGNPLDMGTEFDYFGKRAEPISELELLKSGELNQNQYENRMILRNCMESVGFKVLRNEWWHFNGSSLDLARQKYKVFL